MNTGEADHLADDAVEALAHGREDLVAPAARAHADGCGACAARVAAAGELSRTTRAALGRAAASELDLGALADAALAASALPAATVPPSSSAPMGRADAAAGTALTAPLATSGARAPGSLVPPSRRSLAIAAAVAATTLVPLGALWWRLSSGGGGVFSFARDLIAFAAGVLRLIALAFPGGTTAASAAGLLFVCAIGFALKRLIDGTAAAVGTRLQESST